MQPDKNGDPKEKVKTDAQDAICARQRQMNHGRFVTHLCLTLPSAARGFWRARCKALLAGITFPFGNALLRE